MAEGVFQVAFYLFSTLIIGSALMMVISRSLFYNALFLLVVLLGTAGIYVLLNAEFLAAMQIFVYAGALTVLLLFVIMLTTGRFKKEAKIFHSQSVVGFIVAISLLFLSLFSLNLTSWKIVVGETSHTLQNLANFLFTQYALPFEIASLVLLVALIGAIWLARREEE